MVCPLAVCPGKTKVTLEMGWTKRRTTLAGIALLVLPLASGIGMVINFGVNGYGAWGLQQGGPISMKIYSVQTLLALIAVGVFVSFLRELGKSPSFLRVSTGLLLFFVYFAGFEHAENGQYIYSSLHGMGFENLRPMAAMSLVSILVGSVLVAVGARMDKNADQQGTVASHPAW